MPGLSPKPSVTIILPTYNRARFLPEAWSSICAQTWTDWELIIVDDGSTDNTREVVERLRQNTSRPIHYILQENQGPYGARNTGLDRAAGEFIAFYDSDDLWLPHHLGQCVTALQNNADVDWIYSACRTVDYETGRELVPNTFYCAGKPKPFLNLRRRRQGQLYVIEDSGAVRCQIIHGLDCGLQSSVCRASVFRRLRLPPFRVGEDQILAVLALKAGFRFGYFDRVHVTYNVHHQGTSARTSGSLANTFLALQTFALAYESLYTSVPLTRAERQSLDRRLGDEYFWNIGYALLWRNGRRAEALGFFRRGLKRCPTNVRFWKTYVLASARNLFGRLLQRPA